MHEQRDREDSRLVHDQQEVGRTEPRFDSRSGGGGVCELSGRSVYALCMKRRLTLLERLFGRRRPPTGPLTTEEAADAEESRQKTLASDAEASRHEQKAAGDREP